MVGESHVACICKKINTRKLWWGEQKEETSSKAHAYMKDEEYNGCHGNRRNSGGWIRMSKGKEEDTGCRNDIPASKE
jgi:hypothetical protein